MVGAVGVPGRCTPYQQPASFQWSHWSRNVVDGFFHEIFDGFKAMFSWTGAGLAVGTSIVAKYLPRVTTITMLGATLWGVAGMTKGLYTTFFKTGMEAEESGLEVGRNLLYSIPLFVFSVKLFNRSRAIQTWTAAGENSASKGKVLETVEDFQELEGQLMDYVEFLVKDLPEGVAAHIREVVTNPIFEETAYMGYVEGTKLKLVLSNETEMAFHPLIQAAAELHNATVIVHEAVHLRQNYLRYPSLAVWQTLEKEGLPTKRVIFDLAKYLSFEPSWTIEKEAYHFQYTAIRETLRGVNWKESIKGLFKKAYPEVTETSFYKNAEHDVMVWKAISDNSHRIAAMLELDFKSFWRNSRYQMDPPQDLFRSFTFSDHSLQDWAYLYLGATRVRDLFSS